MTKSRFSDSQIMEVLKRADAGVKVPDIGRELGVSSATFYKWRPKHQRHTAKALCARI
jgi:putative transposase